MATFEELNKKYPGNKSAYDPQKPVTRVDAEIAQRLASLNANKQQPRSRIQPKSSTSSSVADAPLPSYAAPGDRWANDTETYQRGRYDGMQWNRTEDKETLTYKLPDGSSATMTRANPFAAGQQQPQQQPFVGGYNAEQARQVAAQQAAEARYRNMVANGGLLTGRFGMPNTATNRGYTFEGSAEDFEKFNRPVSRPGYTPRAGNETFLEYERQRREQAAQPQMPEAPQGGWQTRKAVYQAQMDHDAKMKAAALGYDANMAKDVLERQRLMQQGQEAMARMGIDARRMQSDAALNDMRRQQLAQEIDTQSQINAARNTLAHSEPGTPENERAKQVLQALGVFQAPEKNQGKIHVGKGGDGETAFFLEKDGTVSRIDPENNGIPSQDQIKQLEPFMSPKEKTLLQAAVASRDAEAVAKILQGIEAKKRQK